jgi:hypothetical protein
MSQGGIAAFTGNLDAEGLEAAIEIVRARHREQRSLRDQIEPLGSYERASVA